MRITESHVLRANVKTQRVIYRSGPPCHPSGTRRDATRWCGCCCCCCCRCRLPSRKNARVGLVESVGWFQRQPWSAALTSYDLIISVRPVPFSLQAHHSITLSCPDPGHTAAGYGYPTKSVIVIETRRDQRRDEFWTSTSTTEGQIVNTNNTS